MTPSKSEAVETPTLRGFDEEFGQAVGVTDPFDSSRCGAWCGYSRRAHLGLVGRRWGRAAAPTSPQNTALAESRELVDRLLSQVEALKSEVRELTEAQQQLAQANAAIEAEQESRNRAPPVHWYSDPAALSSGVESGPEPWGVVPLPRRPASPRR